MKNQIITIIISVLVSGAVAFGVVRFFAPQSDVAVGNVADAVPMPDNLTFMGETVPIHNFDTRESLDRELQVNRLWHSQTILMLKRANRYFPIIEPILKENGVTTLVALTASNEEAQRFYKSVPDSEMKDTGIWMEIK